MKVAFTLILNFFAFQFCLAQVVQTGLQWVSTSLTMSATSPAYSTTTCSNIRYTISTSSNRGFRELPNAFPFNNNAIIIPASTSGAGTIIPMNIAFNQTVSNVRIRFIDLDENASISYGNPEEFLSGITPVPASFSPIPGENPLFLIGNLLTPDDGNASNSNNDASGWLNWSGEINSISFNYNRPGGQFGLVIDSIYFECVNCQPDLGNDTSICIGETLTLDAFSQNSTYLWNDNSVNSSLAVTQAGTYWVEVSNGTCNLVDSIHVSVQNYPQIDLGNDTVLCQNNLLTVSLTDLSLVYTWDDGNNFPSKTLAQTGLYWVDASNGACVSRDSIQLTYLAAPSLDLGNDTTLCSLETLLLDEFSPGLTYIWNDNSAVSSFVVGTAGTYYLEVSNGNCTESDTIQVFYQVYPQLDLGNDTILCDNDLLTISLSDLSLSYSWDDNSNSTVRTLQQSGFYWLDASNGTCVSSDSIQISYVQAPIVFLGNDTTVCDAETVVIDAFVPNSFYLWSDNSTNSSITIFQPGLYWLELSDQYCRVRDSIQVFYQSYPQLELGNDTVLCQNDLLTINLSDQSLSYTWNDNDHSSTKTLVQSAVYWLEASNGTCLSRDSIEINYLPAPFVDLGNDTTLCGTQALTLNAYSPDAVYVWNDHSTNSSLSLNQAGTYSVLSRISNCFDQDTIVVFPYTPFNTIEDITACVGETVVLNATYPSGTYAWNDHTDLAFLEVKGNGTYDVDISDQCGVNHKTFQVHFEICDCLVYAPNAFTPNSDELNQVFEISYFCELDYFSMTIYDKWGEILFESFDPKTGWDGSYGDKLVQEGTYVYKLKYSKTTDELIEEKIGHVNVMN